MGKLVVTEFISVDGVFEDPGGSESFEHGGWTFEYDRGDEGNQFKLDELMDAKVQLLGRITYEGFAAAWPSREGPFADKLNTDPKVVVSKTLTDPQWQNTTVISENVVGGDLEAEGRDGRLDSRLRKRNARRDAPRDRPRRRAAPDGLPDDPRPRQASVPRGHRPAEVQPCREQDGRPGRRPGSGVRASEVGNNLETPTVRRGHGHRQGQRQAKETEGKITGDKDREQQGKNQKDWGKVKDKVRDIKD